MFYGIMISIISIISYHPDIGILNFNILLFLGREDLLRTSPAGRRSQAVAGPQGERGAKATLEEAIGGQSQGT